jgi:hypothetical protein
MMTGEEAGALDPAEQMEAAVATIRGAVLQLLHEGEIHPQLIVLAAARVAGELGAGAALASGQEVATALRELAEVVRQADRARARRGSAGRGAARGGERVSRNAPSR